VSILVAVAVGAPVSGAEDLGFTVPKGFRASLVADHDLANDLYAMTLDARGRVAVTSQGFVKVLHDDDGDGRADRATTFAETPTGGMGLCFDGDDLMFCGDGWLSRYRDRDGDGRADGTPERIIPLAFAEHGGHAMRKGPDGWWYVIGGNDSGIGRKHVTLPHSPVVAPEAGAVLRLPWTLDGCEVIAHGFRNPYDFDFNAAGDLFTYDSDVERDELLPWYSPTRIYHIAHGGHHGWRLTGYMRSWARKPYYVDTVDMLWPVGRGSPTGVTCYRHDQFPEHYRGGLFILDWTFGRVYFFPLRPDGTTYRTEAEVFIEPVGTQGFDPTDVAVAPDGSLYLSIGGRKTRGAVYRIEYVGEGRGSDVRREGLDAVLLAPQPLDAWSRARWEPIARELGRGPFEDSIADGSPDEPVRVRAVEVLTELFGGLDINTARAGARDPSPLVRARVAWSLGRAPCLEAVTVVADLAGDDDPRVRLAALNAWADRLAEVDPERANDAARRNLNHPEERVRQASARLASRLPEGAWERFVGERDKDTAQMRLTTALAVAWRDPDAIAPDAVIGPALDAFARETDRDLRLQAVRLIMLALGDYHLHNPPAEVFTAYHPARPGPPVVAARVLPVIRPGFPSGEGRLDIELARLLAMLRDDDPSTPGRVAAFWTDDSPPGLDMHYLIVFARLKGPGNVSPGRVATVLLGLDRKLRGREARTKQSWNDRLVELVTSLTRRDPRLVAALLEHPEFARPSHVALASALGPEHRVRAARLFWEAARRDPDFAWSGPLIELFTALPAEEVRPALRERWDEFGLRDAILLALAGQPEEADRDRFLAGLESAQARVVAACLGALDRLPRDDAPEHLVPVLRLLKRLELEPAEKTLRARALALIARQADHPFRVDERGTDLPSLRKAYEPVFARFAERHPALASSLEGPDDGDLAHWIEVFKSVDWTKGDADRGEALFRARACQTCHGPASRIGPDLTGVTSRFSRDDLLAAIVAPSREVAPAYRVEVFEDRAGRVVSGIVVFESADGVIVQTGATGTERLSSDDLVTRQPSPRSLMPTGLLDGLAPGEIADLYRYLQTLMPKSQAARPPG
jgi:putative membrane-bound dehydrogenase-like protein